MDAIKLIYNPHSGDKYFKNTIDSCTEVLQSAGYEVHLVRATSRRVMEDSVARMDSQYTAVAVAGGDGTVNLVLNALKRYKKELPLGIIPAGTANDFASYLKMPKDPTAAAEVIANGRLTRTDLGLVNGRYFINVCSTGLLTNVSQQIDTQFKDALGKLAYYIKGLGQLPNFESIPLRITTSNQIIEDEFLLFICLNSSGAGGFDRLSPLAKIDDGLLDCIAFRSMSMIDVAALFLKVLTGDYLDDRRVLFLRESSLKVEHIEKSQIDTDIDGEAGPDMPLSISCVRESFPIFVPTNYR